MSEFFCGWDRIVALAFLFFAGGYLLADKFSRKVIELQRGYIRHLEDELKKHDENFVGSEI